MSRLTEDIMQATIGAVSSTLFFFTLRSDPLAMDPLVGIGITLGWCYLYYKSRKENFFLCLGVTAVVSALMSLAFGLVDMNQLTSIHYFGSIAIIGVWLGLPTAIVMDKFNITNMLKRHYVRK